MKLSVVGLLAHPVYVGFGLHYDKVQTNLT